MHIIIINVNDISYVGTIQSTDNYKLVYNLFLKVKNNLHFTFNLFKR